MALELHLPDLSDGTLGPLPPRVLPPRAPQPWHQQLRELVATYLPLLLMGVLALGTWWLVKNTPGPDVPHEAPLSREEPDYTMDDFVVERFDKDGQLKLRLQGERLRHFAATDIIEVDQAQVRAVSADGRITLARSRRAVANGDGSEVQLIGDARVDSSGSRGEPIQFRGEFLHAFLNTERVRSHLPVVVISEGSEFRAAGMDYDHLSGMLQLQGKMRALLQPSAGARKPAVGERAVTAQLAFITGASSGIGQALALRFAQAGWRLALVARRGAELQAWVDAQGWGAAQARVYAADVRDVRSIVDAGRACIAGQGLPDAVVANAGISVGIDTADFDDLEVLRATLETNNLGMAATFHPFVAAMCQRGSGRLVGIASVAGIRGLPGHGAYSASKAAAISYCESLRGECAPSGVKVVTLLPGYIDTPLTQGNRYSMPFLMPVEAFADRAFAAIVAGDSYRVIPWQMGVVAKLLRLLPNALFDRALSKRGRKRRRQG